MAAQEPPKAPKLGPEFWKNLEGLQVTLEKDKKTPDLSPEFWKQLAGLKVKIGDTPTTLGPDFWKGLAGLAVDPNATPTAPSPNEPAPEAPEFNEDELKRRILARTFMDDYDEVVTHLKKANPKGAWGHNDARNLWDYRKSLAIQAGADFKDPDNLFVILNQHVTDFKKDIHENPEFLNIKFLFSVANFYASTGTGIRLVAWPADEMKAWENLKGFINKLKAAGGSVEQAQKLFMAQSPAQRALALAAATTLAQWQVARCKTMIKARKKLYTDGKMKQRELRLKVAYWDKHTKRYLRYRYTYFSVRTSRRDVKHGCSLTWFRVGGVESYEELRHGKGSGVSIHWDEQGRCTLIMPMRNGKAHGLKRNWSYNDKGPTDVSEQPFIDGKAHGTGRRWSSGKLRGQGESRNGVPHGGSYEWYENGKPQVVGRYINGSKAGTTWRTYHKSGKLSSVGKFGKKGRVGTWQYCDEYGTKTTTEYGPG